jgi:hypothetical protein
MSREGNAGRHFLCELPHRAFGRSQRIHGLARHSPTPRSGFRPSPARERLDNVTSGERRGGAGSRYGRGLTAPHHLTVFSRPLSHVRSCRGQRRGFKVPATKLMRIGVEFLKLHGNG